jgi:DNA-binding SARP family transcriptional activator
VRALVALAAAAAALQDTQAVSLLRRARRWARDRAAVRDRAALPGFFVEVAQFPETARLMLGERRLPPGVAAMLRAVLGTGMPGGMAGGAESSTTDRHGPLSPPGRVPRTPDGGASPAFEIRLFGMPALLRDGVEVGAWRIHLVRELLCFLSLQPERLVRTETIVDALLPDAPTERGLTTIRHAMYHLRRLFAPLDPVRTVRGGYRLLHHPEIKCDLTEFNQLLSRVERAGSRVEDGTRGTEGGERVRLLEEAVALCRGTLLDGLAAEWAEAPRAAAESQVLAAFHKLLKMHEQAGRHEKAVSVALGAVALDPFQDQFHLAAIRNLVAQGLTSRAADQFRVYHRTMRVELGRDAHPEAVRMLTKLVPSLVTEPV